MKPTLLAAAIVLAAAPAHAQWAVASSGATSGSAPGWTFTPSMTVTETYDDNISLFDVHIAPGENIFNHPALSGAKIIQSKNALKMLAQIGHRERDYRNATPIRET